MKPETIYYEGLLYPANSGCIKKHSCKKDCGNHTCPIEMQRAIAQGKLFLTQLMNVTGNSPLKNDQYTLKAIAVKNSVHLSTDDPATKAVSETINPSFFLTAKNFN
jgi:hypothetical protein